MVLFSGAMGETGRVGLWAAKQRPVAYPYPCSFHVVWVLQRLLRDEIQGLVRVFQRGAVGGLNRVGRRGSAAVRLQARSPFVSCDNRSPGQGAYCERRIASRQHSFTKSHS